ncbi:MAG TPA: crossover junction endodeoxyribonuclease RuvC [Candidatus Ozemobacteraceae bacterium]|nr:crossover junction endodeoxyribonuclease RuvC [Candidatus Ozemobacteraceae bacterium]
MALILGLDLAERLGVCLLDDGGPRVVWSASIVLAHRDPAGRLLRLRDLLVELIRRFRPAEVAIEDVFLPERTSRKTPIALGELRGVARLCAAEADLPVSFYPPARVKLAITGSGRASKEDVIRMISSEFKITPKDDNEADAVSIAYTHLLMRRFQSLPQTNP